MDFRLNRYDEQEAQCVQTAKSTAMVKPRTLREQLQDQISHHEAKIADLREAVDSLSPDVEKALNALGKL